MPFTSIPRGKDNLVFCGVNSWLVHKTVQLPAFLIALIVTCSCNDLIVRLSATESLLDKDAPTPASKADWQVAIGVLSRHCFACHGPEKTEGGLRLDGPQWLIRGGDRGSVLERNDLRESLLLKVILGQAEDLEMPPKKPLSSEDRVVLQRWIEAGAPWPQEPSSGQSDTPEELGSALADSRNPVAVKFAGQRLDLWSLRPIALPEIPSSPSLGWAENGVDAFVFSDWESQGLSPAPDADRRTIARRMSFDLIGLPPTYEEVAEFVNDRRPQAVARYADRLMASARYGEHWARMWLDVVRYSDSNGFDWDEFRPQAWQYRDYVVRAFNRDLPFDQFVTQQLAGDELLAGPPTNSDEQDCLIATGYLRIGPHDNSAASFNEQDRSRAELLADLTETTGSALLGLTLSCCRCHDHKTEPLTQEDHYRLRAFFSAVEFADNLPTDLADQQQRIALHNAPLDKQIEQIDVKLKELPKDSKTERQELETEKKGLLDRKQPYALALLMTDRMGAAPDTFVLYQGDHRAQRQKVEPGFPSVLYPNRVPLTTSVNPKTTARRLSLAQWVTSSENPWTARVIVNRLWQAHFGQGLVATPNDFGLSGASPTNVKLLDWLAAELIRNHWSLKHIQRLIVTSHTYRLSCVAEQPSNSAGSALASASYRKSLRRLSAEQLRDALLAVSGLLQHRTGGPPIWPELPAEILQANPAFLDDNAMKTKGWYPSPDAHQTVRSLYLIQKRTVRIPLLETFDLPENSVSCAKRDCSIVAPQALSWLNGSLTQQAAHAMDGQIKNVVHANNDSESTSLIIRLAFQYALQREPDQTELDSVTQFLVSHGSVDLCRVLLNTNEFAFVE